MQNHAPPNSHMPPSQVLRELEAQQDERFAAAESKQQRLSARLEAAQAELDSSQQQLDNARQELARAAAVHERELGQLRCGARRARALARRLIEGMEGVQWHHTLFTLLLHAGDLLSLIPACTVLQGGACSSGCSRCRPCRSCSSSGASCSVTAGG